MNDKDNKKRKAREVLKKLASKEIVKELTQRKEVYKGFDFLGPEEKERGIFLEQIQSILFHRGHFRLLDRVFITPQKMQGKLKITEDMCLGHIMPSGQMVFRGVDFIEMAAQILGIWTAQWPQLYSYFKEKGKVPVPVEISCRLKVAAVPGDLLQIEVKKKNVWARKRTNYILITGENLVIKVEDKEGENIVFSLKLISVDPRSLAK